MARWIVALAMLTLVGCGGSNKVMYKEGFVHSKHPYMVRTAGGGANILPGDWDVDNYEKEESGAIGAAKVGEDYWFGVAFDNDGDGVNEYFEDVARYDLRLVNGVSDAEIFVRTVPLSSQLGRTDAEVILRRFMDAIGQTGQMAGMIPAKTDRTVPQQFATRILSQSSGSVAGLNGLTATFEYANVPPASVSKHTAWRRVKVIMARPDFNWVAGATKSLPAMMVVGYAADPAKFEANEGKFQAFVDSIELLSDAQLLGLKNDLMLNECQPQPAEVTVKATANKYGVRTGFDTEPKQSDDITLCMHSVLDQVKLPARNESRTFEWKYAKRRNPLKARPKAEPTPPPAPEPEAEPAGEEAEAPAAEGEAAEATEAAPAEGEAEAASE